MTNKEKPKVKLMEGMQESYPGANIDDVAKGMVFMLDSFRVAFKYNTNIGIVINTHVQMMNKLLAELETSKRDLEGVNDGCGSVDSLCSEHCTCMDDIKGMKEKK